ncbi:MAG: hypothetical protein AABZ60_07435, partial [Planctomycetota bacterium]
MEKKMLKFIFLFSLFSTLIAPFIFAQTEDTGENAGFPIEQLPSNIPQVEGELTLFADYQNIQKGTLNLYLINKTNTIQTFHVQDGDIYIKLEAQNKFSGETDATQLS